MISRILLLLAMASAVIHVSARPKNVILILADDVGAYDLGCYGSRFHLTPNIDALAARGVMLSQAYASNPSCSPTRCAILTGLDPARVGITNPSGHLPSVNFTKRLFPRPQVRVSNALSVTRLRTEYMTLAGALKESGYHTAHIGKWHLGAEPYSPLEHGFEHDWPHTFAAGPGGANGYFAPWSFAPDVPQKNGEHIEDRCAAEAVQWIRDHKEGPFFLNYWSFSAHGPWMAKPDDIRDFEKRVDPEDGQRNPVYAGMLRALDNAVGSLVRCLAELGIEKETLIVFTSDNGACSWLDAAAMKRFGFTSPPTDNRPLRSGKTSIYEGGTRVPAIIVWPGVIQGGGTASGFFQSTDVYPTILAMLDLPPPRGRIDGLNQVPALTGGEPVRDTVFCHWPHGAANNRPDGFEPSTSVRKGNFKLIRFHSANDDGSDRMELYDLSKDPGEKRNLSTKFPLKAEELGSLIDRYLIDTKAVIPKLNPTFHAP